MTKDELEVQLAELRIRADEWLQDGHNLLETIESFDHSGISAINLKREIGGAKVSINSAITAIRENTPTDN